MNKSIDFKLTRNSFGRLVFTGADGEFHDGVVPVHAFPIAAPQREFHWSLPTGTNWPGSIV